MTHPDESPLYYLTAECCRELFGAYGLPLRQVDRDVFPLLDRLLYCSVMGFGGEKLRGALVLVSTVEPLESTHHGDAASRHDWIRELSNQLMGRVKNRLLPLGAEVLLATPAAISGKNLKLTPNVPSAVQAFEGGGGVVCAWIEYESCDGFELASTPRETSEPVLLEGEFLLF